MIKLDQHGIKVNDEETYSLPDDFSIERRTLLMLTGVTFEDLGYQDEKDAGGAHALTANLSSQGAK